MDIIIYAGSILGIIIIGMFCYDKRFDAIDTYRDKLSDSNWEQYKKLPSFDYMMNHFWIWDFDRFLDDNKKPKNKIKNVLIITILLLSIIVFLIFFSPYRPIKYRYLTVVDKQLYCFSYVYGRNHNVIVLRSEENLIIYNFDPQYFYLLNPGDVVNADVSKFGKWSDGIIKYR